MKKLSLIASIFFCGLPVALQAAPITPAIVNLNAQISSDLGAQTLSLGAGSYNVTFAGISGGGLYDGWNPATANAGAAVLTPAPGLWTERFNMTVGGNTTLYVMANNPTYASAAAALSAYQASFSNGITFSLAAPGNVTFSIADFPGSQWDDFGGVSLKVSSASAAATPEPGTMGAFGLGLVGLGAFLRRKMVKA